MFFLIIIGLLINIQNIAAHSWINDLKCYDNNGNFISIGYIRNYTEINIDITQTKLLEGRNLNADIIVPYIYTDQYPMLQCCAGCTVIFTYNSNGHVSLDQFISTDPRQRNIINGIPYSATTYYSIHWNNKTELLKRKDINTGTEFNNDSGLINYITKHNSFYDGICDDNANPRVPCIGNFTIPISAKNNTIYNYIWYWVSDRNVMASGEEYYSSFDIHIINNIETNNSLNFNVETDNLNNTMIHGCH